MKRRFFRLYQTVQRFARKSWRHGGKWFTLAKRKIKESIRRKPMTSFLVTLFILLLLIALGNFLRKPPVELKKVAAPKQVQTYRIGTAPKLTLQAQVDKSGVVKIVAHAPGIVYGIHVTEGQTINQGNWLVSLASNYFGGNAASVQRQIAQVQYDTIVKTFDAQKEWITKQKELAEKTQDNSEETRNIANQSISETESLLSLNENILASLDADLKQYEATNSTGTNTALILSTKQLKNQYQSAVNTLRGALRNTRFQADENKPPSGVADLQKDVTVKQLEIQERTLDMSREVSKLQLTLARVNEGVMFPAAPFAGIVQRIHVRIGESVNPGTPLVTFAGNTQNTTAFIMAPREIALNISKAEPSILHVGNETIELTPAFVSHEATDGLLHSVIYTIPTSLQGKITDKSFLSVDVPIGYPQTGGAIPYIPIDAIYQTQEEGYVFVAENNTAVSRTIELGEVMGRFVEVKNGLRDSDEVILNRNVISGEKVTSVHESGIRNKE